MAGVSLGFARSPLTQRRIFKQLKREWRDITRDELRRAINRLYESKLISYKDHPDGSVEIILSREGKKIALRYQLDKMTIPKPHPWDQKWRLVLFDIPEKKKRLRDTIRRSLKNLGLMEYQKSVFVHPYECRNEIDFVIELYQARSFIRFIEATSLDNELHLRKHFKLPL